MPIGMVGKVLLAEILFAAVISEIKKIIKKKNLLYVDNPASLHSILFQCGLKLFFLGGIFDLVIVLVKLIPVDSEGKIDAHSRANCTGVFNWLEKESSPLYDSYFTKKGRMECLEWTSAHTHSLTHTYTRIRI